GILRGLASTALAAPLAQLYGMRKGRAAGLAPPKVVFFYTPCGLQTDLWHPTETGKNFALKMLSAPLEPHKADCIFMDGVAMYPQSDHQGGSLQMLAGDDKNPTTLDLKLGDHLASAAPFSTVLLGVQCRISKGGVPAVPHPHFSRKSLNQEVFPEDNPLAAFARVFGQFTPGMGMNNTAGAELLARQRKSLLDNANADLKSLLSSLPGSEKNKIASFTDAIRAMERRLADPSTMPAACSVDGFNPTKFAVPQVSDANSAAYNTAANKSIVTDLQMEIARLSLACGRTRVVSLLIEHTNARQPIPGVGTFGVHDASHFNAPPGQLIGNATPAQIDAKLTAWNAYRVWYAQKLAQFIKMLKDTPDVEGSLFDNTIIFHCSELGTGHRTQRVPFVFAGGRNLGFQLGQSINFNNTVPAYGPAPHQGLRHLAHSTLLTLIAQKMGLPMTTPQYGYAGPQALDYKGLGIVS
ncbi:MAG TPA: DUF1552 domain-containing protein, partial [Polyangia bacterium]